MIKVTDLMVGDWVNYRPGWINEENGQIEYESGTGFPVKIDFIYKATDGEGLVQYNDGENNGIEAAEYELFPIPLTPEILEKNGFNYVKETGYMCYEQLGDRQYNLIAVKGNILQMQFTSGNLEWTECRYVHELQHALKLCGIDKEITL